jgi:hypothetical protein
MANIFNAELKRLMRFSRSKPTLRVNTFSTAVISKTCLAEKEMPRRLATGGAMTMTMVTTGNTHYGISSCLKHLARKRNK